jgi:hypothetical protein
MAVTGITAVELDREEYSQYVDGYGVVSVLIFGPNEVPLVTETLTVQIRKARRNRDVIVAQQTYTFDGVENFQDGVEVTFTLEEILSTPDVLRLMREGNYFIHVINDQNVNQTEDSLDFIVSVIPVEWFKSSFLFGLDLQSAEVRKWRLPPRQITGVTLVETSRAHPAALYPLVYRRSDNGASPQHFLSWSEGDEIIVTTRGRYLLPAKTVQEYVIVDVNPRLFPAGHQQEMLLVEEAVMDDITLRQMLRSEKANIENTLIHGFMEPTVCVTDIDPSQITFSTQNLSPILIDSDWDHISEPVTFYPRNVGDWIDIQLPEKFVQRVDALFGAVANTRIVDINLEWIELSRRQGFIQLVPFNQEIAFDFIGLVWVESLRGQVAIPSFWHYNIVSGLRDVPGEVFELLGRRAAIPILTLAGQAFRSGYASQSVSRDGVSESVSYTASAVYGIYSASIEDHKRWIKENESRIRAKYRGLSMVVM